MDYCFPLQSSCQVRNKAATGGNREHVCDPETHLGDMLLGAPGKLSSGLCPRGAPWFSGELRNSLENVLSQKGRAFRAPEWGAPAQKSYEVSPGRGCRVGPSGMLNHPRKEKWGRLVEWGLQCNTGRLQSGTQMVPEFPAVTFREMK